MKIFIDTSAFLALLIDNEADHPRVTAQYQTYRKHRSQFFTSYYILDELYTRLIYDFGKPIVQKAMGLIDQAAKQQALTLLDIDEATFEEAKNTLLKFAEHKISLTDATTYVLYKSLRLDEIFTLDRDFKKIRAATSL